MLYDEELEEHVIGPRVPRRYLTALDLQVNLIDALTEDSPSGEMTRQWFAGTFDSMTRQGGGLGLLHSKWLVDREYRSRGLTESQMRALIGSASGPADGNSNGVGFVLSLAEALDRAPTYHIEPNMMGFISDVADSMPDDVVAHPEDAPSTHGWLHFQTPVQVIDRWGTEYLIRAALWSHGEDVPATGEKAAGFGITDFAGTWEDPDLKKTIRDDQQRLKAQGRAWYPPELSIFHVDTVRWGESMTSPATLSKQMHVLREQVAAGKAPEVEGIRLPNDDELHALMSTAWMRRFVVASWMVMQGKIGRPRRAAPSKRQQKDLRKRGFDWGDIRVVTLRSVEYSGGEDDEDRGKVGREVEWTHRWAVRGFWRWQWYPSAPGPCGHCGREGGEHRRKWIEPYVKGPDHLPYIAKDAVFVVNR